MKKFMMKKLGLSPNPAQAIGGPSSMNEAVNKPHRLDCKREPVQRPTSDKHKLVCREVFPEQRPTSDKPKLGCREMFPEQRPTSDKPELVCQEVLPMQRPTCDDPKLVCQEVFPLQRQTSDKPKPACREVFPTLQGEEHNISDQEQAQHIVRSTLVTGASKVIDVGADGPCWGRQDEEPSSDQEQVPRIVRSTLVTGANKVIKVSADDRWTRQDGERSSDQEQVQHIVKSTSDTVAIKVIDVGANGHWRRQDGEPPSKSTSDTGVNKVIDVGADGPFRRQDGEPSSTMERRKGGSSRLHRLSDFPNKAARVNERGVEYHKVAPEQVRGNTSRYSFRPLSEAAFTTAETSFDRGDQTRPNSGNRPRTRSQEKVPSNDNLRRTRSASTVKDVPAHRNRAHTAGVPYHFRGVHCAEGSSTRSLMFNWPKPVSTVSSVDIEEDFNDFGETLKDGAKIFKLV